VSSWLCASPGPLVDVHDVALLDLDGTVHLSGVAVPGAPALLAAARHRGLRLSFVTNNASRTPADVAGQLTALGVAATAADVVTAAQAAAGLLAERLTAGSRVLVVGGEGLRAAVAEEGLVPVRSADDDPAAVVQGWSPDLAWASLAEGAYALAAGLPWVVSNTDRTLPTARGIAPGNGSFVDLLAATVGRRPDAVAGKPQPPLLLRAASRTAAVHPLVVGDRLDTDIEGAVASGMPSLLVLTGVSGVADLLAAGPAQRPTYLAADLSGLFERHDGPVVDGDGWVCGEGRARVHAGRLDVGRASPDALRAACAAAWSAQDAGHPVEIPPGVLALLAMTRRGR